MITRSLSRRGVDFVGWRSWWSHRIARRQTLAALDRRLARFACRRVVPAFGGRLWRLDLAPAPLLPLRGALASYAGHLRHGAAWRDWQRRWRRHPWLTAAFAPQAWAQRLRWSATPSAAASLQQQYRRLLRGTGNDGLLLVASGRYLECYGPQRLRAQAILGLRPIRLARAGYAFTAGFPLALAAAQISRADPPGARVFLARRRAGASLQAQYAFGTPLDVTKAICTERRS